MAEIAIKIVSALAMIVPVLALIRAIIHALFPEKVIISDHKGKVLRTITAESVIRDNPAELKRFHKDVQRRIRDAKAA